MKPIRKDLERIPHGGSGGAGFIILFLIHSLVSGCRPNYKEVLNVSGEAMGTTYRVIAGVGEDAMPLAQDDIDYLLWDINQSLSTWDERSLIAGINASRDTSVAHELDAHFITVFRKAKEIHELTGGAFNPAVGPLVRAWGFGPDPASDPDSTVVRDLLRLVDFEAFRVTGDRPPRLKKSIAAAELDFSAIAKGYAVDELGRLLESGAVTDYLVDIGGEIRVRGRHPDGRPWRVGIEKPVEGARGIETILELSDVSMATSGNYRNFRVVDGHRFVHTINPETGFTEQNRLLSATVLAPDCMTADAFATAIMVMGFERAVAFSTEASAPEMYLIAGGDSLAFETFATDALSRSVVSPQRGGD